MKKTLIALFSSAAILISHSVFADLYIGGAIGDADYNNDLTDNSLSLVIGYDVSDFVAIEFSYVDAGSATGPLPLFDDEITANTSTVATSVVFEKSITDQLSVIANVGLHVWEVDVTTNFNGTNSVNGTDLTYGVGSEFDITDGISALVKWQRYAVELYGESEEIEDVSVGVRININ